MSWDPELSDDEQKLGLLTINKPPELTYLTVATDFIILVMPMFILYSLQLPKSQKISVMFVFALGGL